METFEIYTLGTGYYLEKILNALRIIIGDGGFTNLLKISAMCALMMIAIRATVSADYKIISRWMLSAVVIVSLFIGTRATVLIHDTLPDAYGRASAARSVENVPWGLAALASITSMGGNYLGEKFEMAFAGVFNNASYQKTGMLFGTKIVEDTANLRITDPQISQFMLRFYRGCIVPDVLMGKERKNGYTLSELVGAEDLANFLSEHSSKARMISYGGELDKYPLASSAERSKASKAQGYITCKEAAERLEVAFGAESTQLEKVLSSSFLRHFFPSSTERIGGLNSKGKEAADPSFQAILQDSYSLFINSGRSASDILKQTTVINALKDSVNNVDSLGEAYASISTNKIVESSFSSLSKWASKLSLQLKSAFEAVIYGLFPLVLVLLVTPIGLEVLKNYAMSFVYLQMWQPIYSILFCMAAAYGEYEASGVNALTFASHGAIARVNHDISMIAGYMLLCVPVIALYATRGAFSSMGNMASSIFYVPQHAAISASEQAVRGNYSMGNTSVDTHSFNNVSGNKYDDNYAWMSGMKSFATASGSIEKGFADGRPALDISPSLSNMGGLTRINLGQIMGSRLEQSETSALNDLNRHSSDMVESRSSAYSRMLGFYSHFSRGSSEYQNWQKSLGSEERQNFEESYSMLSRFAQDHNISTDSAVKLAFAASAGLSFDKIPMMPKLSDGADKGAGLSIPIPVFAKVSVGADWSKASNYRKAYDALISGDTTQRYAESFAKMESYMNNNSYQEQSGLTRDQLDSVKQDLHTATSANYARNHAIERVEGISKLRSAYQSNSASIDQDLQHKYAEWGIEKYGATQFEEIQRNDPVRANKLAHEFMDSVALPIPEPVTSSGIANKFQQYDQEMAAGSANEAKLSALAPTHSSHQEMVTARHDMRALQTYAEGSELLEQNAGEFKSTVMGGLSVQKQTIGDGFNAKQTKVNEKLIAGEGDLKSKVKAQEAMSGRELQKGIHIKVGESLIGKEKSSRAFAFADEVLEKNETTKSDESGIKQTESSNVTQSKSKESGDENK